MKHMIVTICITLMVLGLFAYPIRIQSWKMDEDIKTLNSLNVSIDYVNRQTGVIHAYVRNSSEHDKVSAAGILAIAMPDAAKEYARQLWEETKDSRDPMRNYYSLAEYHTFMQQTAAQYPNICSLVQFGTSEQNRPLYFLKISDNVSQEENEPEIKLVSSIHGDEVVGFDLLIRLIQLLTAQYGTNTRITNIVNNTELWINPMMNPDGNALVQRYNANDIDLNRNFPMPTGVQHPDGNDWAAETEAMMNFSLARDFDLGLSFHGGALVINYPWDYTYTLAPDDLLLREMSLTYSRENTPMYNSSEFPQGITNGAAWYVTTGCMQDWNYFYTDCIELTAEVSNIKWPSASTLDTFWAQNQESLLKYMEFAQKGVHGVVTNSAGTPLAATITVTGNSMPEKTDMPLGDYHRLLLPGTYQITASSSGYLPQTISITVPDGNGIIQNFALQTAGLTTFKGQVRNQAGQALANAQVTLSTSPVSSVTADANGLFQISNIYEGSYTLSIVATGYAAHNSSINISQTDFRIIIIMQAPLFSDNFESGLGAWSVTGNWGIVTSGGSMALTDSPAGNYGNNHGSYAKLTSPISLQGVSNPGISFRCKYALESGYDFAYVEASTNGNTWTQLGSFTGIENTWQNQYYSLQAYSGANVYLRFRIRSDTSETADGIYIDDVVISGNSSNSNVFGDVTSDSIISKADLEAISRYAIGADSLPILDPRPWEAYRLNNADVDNNDAVDAFDAYLLCKYISEAQYLLPVQSGEAEPVNDPGLVVSYNGSLNFNFANIDYLKSLTFSALPNDLISVSHQGFPINNPYIQVVNQQTESYAFAGYNIDQTSLYATLASNPQSFTIHYTVNGIAGSQFVNTSSANADNTNPGLVTALLPAAPNPFNPETTIYFTLGDFSQDVDLGIYNLKGQKVRSLVSANLPAGNHHAQWNGKDDEGRAVASGVYLYRLITPKSSHTRKMLLSK